MADFHFTLPAPTAEEAPDTEGVNEQITDHADRAVDRLGLQYRKPKIEALVRAFMGPVQELEDTLWAMYTERFVSTAVGAQLDLIGRIVGQERLGYDDDGYRRLVRARIAANRSDGIVADLVTITTLVIDDEVADIVVDQQHPAAVVVRVEGEPVTEETANIAISLLRRGASGGVRILFEYSESDDTDTFAFDGGTGLGFGDSTNPATGGDFAAVTE
jgi:hypothetical protein